MGGGSCSVQQRTFRNSAAFTIRIGLLSKKEFAPFKDLAPEPFDLFWPLLSSFFLFFWLCCVFVATLGLSVVAASGDYFLVAVCRLLTVVASLVAEHGL